MTFRCLGWLLPVLGLAMAGCSRSNDPVVGRVLGEKIYASDFKVRYQKYLAASKERDNVLVRERVLNNMINERLILHEVHRLGLDDDRTYRDKEKEIEEQALLDGFSRRISVDTLHVTEQELWQEFRASRSKAAVRYVYARTRDSALVLRGRLQHGATFGQIAREVFQDPDLAQNGGYVGFFGYGEMDPEFDQASFTLPVGELSPPVKFGAGYAILQVQERVETPLASDLDFAAAKPKLEQAVLRRKTVARVREEADKASASLAPVFNPAAVTRVFDAWHAISAGLSDQPDGANGSPATDSLASMPFGTFAGHAWTVGDFVRNLGRTTRRQRARVKGEQDVRDIALGLASRDVLLDKARGAGLEGDEKVKEQIKRLREEWLWNRWAVMVQDSVVRAGISEEGLRAQYAANQGSFVVPPQINAAEILVRTQRKADSLARLARSGKDFARLARENTIRTGVADQGGELGFQPQSAFGAQAPRVAAAKVGAILGPFPQDPYFAVYKLLARQPSRPMTFEEVRTIISAQLMPARKQEAFLHALERLRASGDISIDMQSLSLIEIQPT